MKQKTQYTITNDNNNDNKVKIFSRVKDFILSKRHTHDEKNMRTVNQNYGEKNVSSVA